MALAFALPGQAAVWSGCSAGDDGLRRGDRADRCADERPRRGNRDPRGLHLMNLTHAAYSFGYAGAAVLTGVRGAGWGPAWVMGTMAAVALAVRAADVSSGTAGSRAAQAQGRQAPHLGLVPVIGGGIVLIAFMTENASETGRRCTSRRRWAAAPRRGAGPGDAGADDGVCAAGRAMAAGRVEPLHHAAGRGGDRARSGR
jgi:hypothetical protein